MNSKDFRPRLKGNKRIAYDNLTTNERRILVVGDIHAPFELEGYLEFCQETYAKHLCNQVVFIAMTRWRSLRSRHVLTVGLAKTKSKP